MSDRNLDGFYKNAYFQGMLAAANEAGVKLASFGQFYDDLIDSAADRIGDFDEYVLGGRGKASLMGGLADPNYVSDLSKQYALNQELGQHARANNAAATARANREMQEQARQLALYNEYAKTDRDIGAENLQELLGKIPRAQDRASETADFSRRLGYGFSRPEDPPSEAQVKANNAAIRRNAQLQTLLRQAAGAERRALGLD